MIRNLQKLLHFHFHNPNYLYFLLSIVLLIVLPSLAQMFELGLFVLNLTFGLVLLMGAVYTSQSIQNLLILSVWGVLLYTVFLLNHFSNFENIRFLLLTTIGSFAFFALCLRNIVWYLLTSEDVGVNEVFASMAGYAILGVIATPTFYTIEQLVPGSISVSPGYGFDEMMYFSYVTLTTVGYGDISPVSPLARSFSVLVGLTGQLYLTILIAIIIGKYLAPNGADK